METLEELMAERSWLEGLYFDNLQDEIGADLVLAHIELMQEAGEAIPAPALAVAALIQRNRALL